MPDSISRLQDYIGRDPHLADLASGVQPIRQMFRVDGIAGPSQLVYDDFDHFYSHFARTTNTVTAAPYRVVYITRFDNLC